MSILNYAKTNFHLNFDPKKLDPFKITYKTKQDHLVLLLYSIKQKNSLDKQDT